MEDKNKDKTIKKRSKIIAVDFDKTLTTRSSFPLIGPPNHPMIELVKKLKEDGHRIVLWTCRGGRKLKEAVNWCESHGIKFDGVNEDLSGISDSNKIYADIYIDDRAINADDINKIDKML